MSSINLHDWALLEAPVFHHPYDEMRLLLHDFQVLGGAGVQVTHRETERVRLNLHNNQNNIRGRN